MRSTDDYLGLIEPQHATKPRFTTTVGLNADVFSRLQTLLAAIPGLFDLDVAIGAQLDVDGQWIGQSRQIQHALPGVFFTLDDPIRGLDQGFWKGPYDTGYGLYSLDDDTYRRLLRTKILINTWDGTFLGIQSILDEYFSSTDSLAFVQDDCLNAISETYFSLDDPARGFDQATWAPSGVTVPQPSQPALPMVVTIGIAGATPNLVDVALLQLGLVYPNPIGAVVDVEVSSVNRSPLFGFDIETSYVSGFDVGALGISPAMVQANGT